MTAYLHLAQVVISVALIGIVLLQTRNSGLGSSFGGDSIYKTRRGLDRTLFQLTIVLAVLFALISLVSVLLAG
ncbi:MAG: preprotein translocase subunit SecG [Chloroflexi bacterium]|jgi:preprotein translocase subunit SecG|nr:MAG: preprotein translocase subunit SecG [Chloroflexota bacterium]